MKVLVARIKRKILGTSKKQAAEFRRLSAEINSSLNVGNTEGALECCSNLAEFLKLSAEESYLPEVQQFLAVGYFNLGADYRSMQKVSEAELAFAEAIRNCESLRNDRIYSRFAAFQIASCKNHLGLLYMDNGFPDKASAKMDEAIVLRRTIAEHFPEDRENRVYLGGAICNRAILAQRLGKNDDAASLYDESIRILEEAVSGCECGTQDVILELMSKVTGQSNWLKIAHQFKVNAEQGKRSLAQPRST